MDLRTVALLAPSQLTRNGSPVREVRRAPVFRVILRDATAATQRAREDMLVALRRRRAGGLTAIPRKPGSIMASQAVLRPSARCARVDGPRWAARVRSSAEAVRRAA
ncbi:MAG: hypothetical protein LBV34_05130, partial [Nocardiopsaceae bacterium]|nr:hypothetical protein [Nocardiopsaceae bacterium]